MKIIAFSTTNPHKIQKRQNLIIWGVAEKIKRVYFALLKKDS